MAAAARIPAVITAGGRLHGAMAEAAGTTVKALAPVGGVRLIDRMLAALRGTGRVGTVACVGPIDALSSLSDIEIVEEGATGPENVERGLRVVAEEAGEGLVLLCASDLPFVDTEAVAWLLDNAPQSEVDIVFPVITREDYDRRFPGSPNTWAKLAGREYTGGSVMLVRPAAITRNRALIERVFAARKSQLGMARLLGMPFVLRFATGRLTILQAEARASELTGCRCIALLNADPRLAADIDTLAEYEWANALYKRRGTETLG